MNKDAYLTPPNNEYTITNFTYMQLNNTLMPDVIKLCKAIDDPNDYPNDDTYFITLITDGLITDDNNYVGTFSESGDNEEGWCVVVADKHAGIIDGDDVIPMTNSLDISIRHVVVKVGIGSLISFGYKINKEKQIFAIYKICENVDVPEDVLEVYGDRNPKGIILKNIQVDVVENAIQTNLYSDDALQKTALNNLMKLTQLKLNTESNHAVCMEKFYPIDKQNINKLFNIFGLEEDRIIQTYDHGIDLFYDAVVNEVSKYRNYLVYKNDPTAINPIPILVKITIEETIDDIASILKLVAILPNTKENFPGVKCLLHRNDIIPENILKDNALILRSYSFDEIIKRLDDDDPTSCQYMLYLYSHA